MHCHCGTNNRAPRWTFTDPCKPEVRPGAREESASPAWLAAPAMNARDTKLQWESNTDIKKTQTFGGTQLDQATTDAISPGLIDQIYQQGNISSVRSNINVFSQMFAESVDLMVCVAMVYRGEKKTE